MATKKQELTPAPRFDKIYKQGLENMSKQELTREQLVEKIACKGCLRESECDSTPIIHGIPKHMRCKGQLQQANDILSLIEQFQPDKMALLESIINDKDVAITDLKSLLKMWRGSPVGG